MIRPGDGSVTVSFFLFFVFVLSPSGSIPRTSAACLLSAFQSNRFTTQERALATHLLQAFWIKQKLSDQRCEFIGCVARDDITRLRDTHCLGCSAGSSGDDGCATRLCFQQHHAEPFNISADLPVGQHKQVTLLITPDHGVIVEFSQELDVLSHAFVCSQFLQCRTFGAVTDDGIQDIRKPPRESPAASGSSCPALCASEDD